MSAAATPPYSAERPGWPAPGPGNGFCAAPHFFNERIWRITEPGKVQAACISLILDQTRGYQRDWACLAPGWFHDKLNLESDDTRSVRDALKDAVKRGLIEQDPAADRLSRYRVNLDAIRTAPDYEAQPQPVEDPEPAEEPGEPEPPGTRHIPENSGVTYYDKPLKQYHAGPLLIAEQRGTATVALCGECETVGIFEMIGAEELSIQGGEEKAKQTEPQFHLGDVNPRNHSPPDSPTPPPEEPDKAAFADARHQAVHDYMRKWKPAFDRLPYHEESLRVAKALGEAPIDYLDALLRRKGFHWFRNNARHFGAFLPFARDALSAYVYDVGELCPGCKKQRLKPGEICARCFAPEPQATKPEQHEDGDWGPVKAELAKSVPHIQWNTWVEPTWIDSVSGDSMRVGVPNSQTRNCLTGVYGAHVEEALKAAHGDRYSQVEYIVEVQRE